MKKLISWFSNSPRSKDATGLQDKHQKHNRKLTNGEVMPGELFKLYEKVLLRPKDIVDQMK
jgi:hypothetical protein